MSKPKIRFVNGRWIAQPRRADHTAHHLARMYCDRLNWSAQRTGVGHE